MTIQQKQVQDQQRSNDKRIEQKYKKQHIIGHGTFGCVYFATTTSNTAPYKVAIKHVHQNKKYKNRQIQILKLLKHSNIVQLYQYYYEQKNNVIYLFLQKHYNHDNEQNTYLNLIMQYVPETLSSIIKDHLYCKTYINDQLIIKYSYGLLKAVEYLQSMNIAHRDIKPSNILLTSSWLSSFSLAQAKLCDFGSSKQLVQTQKNISYICSRYYRAPELILGAIQYTTQIDIWSLGCCIAEIIMNRPMFQGENNNVIMLRIIKILGVPTLQQMSKMKVKPQEIKKIEHVGIKERILKSNKDANNQIINLVEKMLVYDPEKRITAKQALKMKIFEHLRQSDNNNKGQIKQYSLIKSSIQKVQQQNIQQRLQYKQQKHVGIHTLHKGKQNQSQMQNQQQN